MIIKVSITIHRFIKKIIKRSNTHKILYHVCKGLKERLTEVLPPFGNNNPNGSKLSKLAPVKNLISPYSHLSNTRRASLRT